jgi:hypothetical protein
MTSKKGKSTIFVIIDVANITSTSLHRYSSNQEQNSTVKTSFFIGKLKYNIESKHEDNLSPQKKSDDIDSY